MRVSDYLTVIAGSSSSRPSGSPGHDDRAVRAPQTNRRTGRRAVNICAVGGKLGGNEPGYASDLDLVSTMRAEPRADAAKPVTTGCSSFVIGARCTR
jgi:glutamine synthetase adenylyltransferase